MIRADDNYVHSEITDKVIGCAYDVYNQLGFGFMEKVYENAMMIKLPRRDLTLFNRLRLMFTSKTNLSENTLPIFWSIAR
jgi:GxxExxY protein